MAYVLMVMQQRKKYCKEYIIVIKLALSGSCIRIIASFLKEIKTELGGNSNWHIRKIEETSLVNICQNVGIIVTVLISEV